MSNTPEPPSAEETPSPCAGSCGGSGKDETPISCGQAKERHGVCIRHGSMTTNGERRFRLNASDGSAYIRTETPEGAKGWQKAHFHRNLRETYIVQKGWIGYAELRGEEPIYRKHLAGAVFTTPPGVVHNIYMPEHAVIHTVKHGGHTNAGRPDPDWWENGACSLLMQKIGKTFAPDDQIVSKSPEELTQGKKPYSDGYRHFDTLIWQVPVAASTLFAVVVGAANAFLTPNIGTQGSATDQPLNLVAREFGLTLNEFAGLQFAIFGVLVAILAFAMYRFRWHQVRQRTWRHTPQSPVVSPQTLLQGVVIAEAALLLLAAAYFFGWHKSGALSLGLVAILWGHYWYFAERKLELRAKPEHPQVLAEEDAADASPIQGAS